MSPESLLNMFLHNEVFCFQASESNFKEFQVLQVSCASQEWKINHLSSTKHSGNDNILQDGSFKICKRETLFSYTLEPWKTNGRLLR